MRWWPEQVVPGVEGVRWRVGAARARVVVAGEPPAIVGLLDPRKVGLEAGSWICLRSSPGRVQAARRGDEVGCREVGAAVRPVGMVGEPVEVRVRTEAAGNDRAGETGLVFVWIGQASIRCRVWGLEVAGFHVVGDVVCVRGPGGPRGGLAVRQRS